MSSKIATAHPLTISRQLYKDARSEYDYWGQRKNEFEREQFFSRTHWRRLGYIVNDDADPVLLTVKTYHGNKCYEAFHSSDVEVLPRHWSRLLKLLNKVNDRFKPTVNNRRLLHRELIASGLNDYASNLAQSTKTKIKMQAEMLHHQWLTAKLIAAEVDLSTVSRSYFALLEPTQSAKKERAQKQDIINKLKSYGVEYDHNTSLKELDEQLAIVRQSRRMEAEEKRVAQERRQFSEALELLKQRGIDFSAMPAGVMPNEVIDLAMNGRMGSVPKRLDLGGILDYLRANNRLLTLWAFDHYPQFIKTKSHARRRKLRFCLPKPEFLSQNEVNQLLPHISILGCELLDVVIGSEGKRYYLLVDQQHVTCTCPSAKFRDGDCKHVSNWKGKHPDWITQLSSSSSGKTREDHWSDYGTSQ